MNRRLLIFFYPLITAFISVLAIEPNGGAWTDTDGNRINCHGGSMLLVDSTYYWYGEHRPGFDSDYQKGVACYYSTDLHSWHNAGIVLNLPEHGENELTRGCIIERPKIIYCPLTEKYVMWVHHEIKGRGYDAARSAVAVSNSPTGPFTLLHSGRINPGIFPENFTREQKETTASSEGLQWWTPEWHQAVTNGLFTRRDIENGQMARDMTLFVDTDGKAYHIYSSEENLTLHIAELTPDFTSHTGRYVRIFPGGHNEAPVMFKHDDKYWLITSGCTGWKPNEARMFSANSIFGPWSSHRSPCSGPEAQTTFGAQGAFHVNIRGNDYFVADMWRPECLADSRTIILPIYFRADGTPVIPWMQEIEF